MVELELPGPRKRRPWRRWVAVLIVLSPGAVLGLLRLVPCWPSYRSPESFRLAGPSDR